MAEEVQDIQGVKAGKLEKGLAIGTGLLFGAAETALYFSNPEVVSSYSVAAPLIVGNIAAAGATMGLICNHDENTSFSYRPPNIVAAAFGTLMVSAAAGAGACAGACAGTFSDFVSNGCDHNGAVLGVIGGSLIGASIACYSPLKGVSTKYIKKPRSFFAKTIVAGLVAAGLTYGVNKYLENHSDVASPQYMGLEIKNILQ